MPGTQRQQIEAIWAGEEPEYFPYEPCGFWKETIDRWHREGLPLHTDPNIAAGLEDSWFSVLPLNSGIYPEYEVQLISEDDQYAVLVDELGVKKRMLTSDYYSSKGKIKLAGETSSMSEWLDFPVKNIGDWETLFAERFKPDLDGRLPENWKDVKQELISQSKDKMILYYNFPSFGTFGAVRQLMGFENMVMASADCPELISRISSDLAEHFIKLFRQVFQDVKIDIAMFFEDMCYNHGPLISPQMFAEYFSPTYRKMSRFFGENGISQMQVDTDGNAMKMIPEFIKAGVTGLFPLEVQSGMNPEEIRKLYPELNLKGGIDKRALRYDKAAISHEVSLKFKIAREQKKYLPWVDHGIPPDVSWDNFRYFVECYKKNAGYPV